MKAYMDARIDGGADGPLQLIVNLMSTGEMDVAEITEIQGLYQARQPVRVTFTEWTNSADASLDDSYSKLSRGQLITLLGYASKRRLAAHEVSALYVALIDALPPSSAPPWSPWNKGYRAGDRVATPDGDYEYDAGGWRKVK